MTEHSLRLNLGVDGVSETIELDPAGAGGGPSLASIHLQAPATWTGEARLRLSLSRKLDRDGDSLESFIDFETAIVFTASELLIRGIPILAAGHIRLEVSTVDASSGTVWAVVVLS